MNQQIPDINEENIGDYFDPVFIRPIKLFIFDGCSMNLDKDNNSNPVTAGFTTLDGSLSNFILAWNDERNLDRIGGEHPNYFVKNNPVKLREEFSVPYCSYQLNGICLNCVNNYILNRTNNSCIECTNSYNSLNNTCNNFESDETLSYNFQETYNDESIDKTKYSPNILVPCIYSESFIFNDDSINNLSLIHI